MSSLEEKIEKLVEPKIVNLGYELYDVQYVKEGKDYFLRIFIDNPNGISLEDCEKVNNAITDLLDDANYIKQQYFLEVSSPGVERILRKDKHLKDNIGEKIEIKLFKPINKKKEIIGILEQYYSFDFFLFLQNQHLFYFDYSFLLAFLFSYPHLLL